MSDQKTLSVYADKVRDYDATFAGHDSPYVHDFIAAVPKEAHVLDLGCGTGQWSLAMAKAGLLVHARDASREMLALVAEHANLTKTQATFDDLSEDNTFDGVFASFSLLHAPRDDMPRHLSSIARALKPCGHLYLGMKTGSGEGRDDLGRYYAYYTRGELDERLAEAGFEILSVVEAEERGLAGTLDPTIHILARLSEDG